MTTKSERFGEVENSRKIQDGRRAAIFYRTELKIHRGRKSPKMNTLAKFWADRRTCVALMEGSIKHGGR